MKRKDALAVIRVAGYHDDQKTFVSTYVEHRISFNTANAEYRRGQEMKKSGIACSCRQCEQKKAA